LLVLLKFAFFSDDRDSDSDSSDSDEDDTAELMAELARIKAERAAEAIRKVWLFILNTDKMGCCFLWKNIAYQEMLYECIENKET
jgi:hypothetical protein